MMGEPGQQLGELYAEWREWTEAEGAAIRRDAWAMVTRCQEQKRQLQARILAVTEACHPRVGQAGWERMMQGIRPLLSEICAQESRNQEYLDERRQHACASLTSLDQSAGRLRGLHRAYAGGSHSSWHSYS